MHTDSQPHHDRVTDALTAELLYRHERLADARGHSAAPAGRRWLRRAHRAR